MDRVRASGKVSLGRDSIQFQVKSAVRELVTDAEQVRLVVASVEAEAAEMFAACGIEELRASRPWCRLACRAERLEAIADVQSLELPSEAT